MRALGYFAARNSDEAAASSLEKQRQAFEEYCLTEKHRVVAVFQDDLSSTSSARTGYWEMVAFIKASSEGFLVIVADSPILGDNLEQVVTEILRLNDLSSQITCMDSRISDPIQNALHHFLGTRNRRIREAMTSKALRGESLGKPPYGYYIDTTGKLEIIPSQAQVVERIFSLYAEGNLGIRRITQLLNTEEITTRNGGRWNVVAVMELLKNPVYQGTYQRFGFRIPQNHSPIVAPAFFRKAQDVMRSRRIYRRQARAEPYLLSGLLYCGFCGSRMIGVTRHQTWRKKDSTRMRRIYRYYQCQARANQSICEYRTRRAQELEELVIGVSRVLLLVRREKSEATQIGEEVTALPGVKEGNKPVPKAWERRWLQAVRFAAKGGMSLTRLGLVLDDLAKEYSQDADWGQASSLHLDELALLEEDNWQRMDFPQRQALLRRLVKGVTVTKMDCKVLLH